MNNIPIKADEEVEKMRIACRLAAAVLDYVSPYVQPGISTDALNTLCHDYIIRHDAIPAPLNYAPPGHQPYPKSICTSVNHQVCHGIPSKDRILKAGDILNIDVTVIKDGWHGDTCRMFLIGDYSRKAEHLCETAYDCLWQGIAAVRNGARFGDIGAAIQRCAEMQHYSIVREFCGHGLGREFHEPPQVLHYGQAGEGAQLKTNMVFTIEPMINAGRAGVKVLSDGWTVVTRDRSLSAQWEHTVRVTDDGCEVLTLSDNEASNRSH